MTIITKDELTRADVSDIMDVIDDPLLTDLFIKSTETNCF